MKKSLVGAIVGAIIIFVWQFLSFGLINLHKASTKYTDKQDAIMSFLQNQGLEDGGYLMPTVPETAGNKEMEEKMKESDGKPWATIQYHSKAENSMGAMTINMIRGLLVNFVVVFLFCWIIRKMVAPSFGTILGAALAIGMIAFLNEPYTGFIWYKTFDIWAFFLDAVIAWGLTGLWLAWWMTRRKADNNRFTVDERSNAAVA